jgi:hypothetical protein
MQFLRVFVLPEINVSKKLGPCNGNFRSGTFLPEIAQALANKRAPYTKWYSEKPIKSKPSQRRRSRFWQ